MNPKELVKKHPSDIAEYITSLESKEQTLTFINLPGHLEGKVFAYLSHQVQANILKSLGTKEIAEVLTQMSPDDRAKVFAGFPDRIIKEAVNLLADEERESVMMLIGYAKNTIGRIMTPYYIQIEADWTVAQTLAHIKQTGKKAETLNFVYVVDAQHKLIDDIKIGEFLMAEPDELVSDLMDKSYASLHCNMLIEDAIPVFEKYDSYALPVVSENGVLVGIVTFDDILESVEQRDTKEMQKFGGVEALDLPYVSTSLYDLVRKRAGWLVILFLGEMFTATAMGYFEEELAKAVVLALFVPLIISSGGNSGSQAATLIIRAMALKEISLKDWWYVMRRELSSGFSLGCILGLIGFIRILIWQETGLYNYGPHWVLIGLTVSFSLIGIVLWGTFSGAMIPFILKKFKLDPATSSAPFVATLVDVTGLVIYFTIAAIFLQGTIL